MRNTLALLILFCLVATASAATRITAILTITNLPNGNTQSLTWNGSSTRTWTNAVASASTQIQTTNSIAAAVTNLKVQLDGHKFQTWHRVAYGTNATTQVVVLAGTNEPISITIAGLWATVTYITNQAYSSDFLMVPPRGNESNAFMIWQWTAVATNLEKGTQAISYTSYPFTNFPHQYRTENPPLTNASIFGGTNQPSSFLATNGGQRNTWGSNVLMTNMTGSITNATVLNGTNIGTVITNSPRGQFTNLWGEVINVYGGTLTNVTIYGSTLSGVVATGSLFTVTGSGLGTWVTIDSFSTTASLGPAIHFTRAHGLTNAVVANDYLGHIIFGGYGVTAQKAAARIIGYAEGAFTDTSAPGYLTFWTAPTNTVTPVVRMHIASTGRVTVSNQLAVVGAQTNASTLEVLGALTAYDSATVYLDLTVGQNATVSGLLDANTATFGGNVTHSGTTTIDAPLLANGSNRFSGPVYHTITNVTGVANGDILLDLGLNKRVHVLSGNTGTNSLCGIKYGFEGREMRIVKTNAFNLTIRNASGAAGTANEERILTGYNADRTVTNVTAVLDFVYITGLNAWLWVNPQGNP